MSEPLSPGCLRISIRLGSDELLTDGPCREVKEVYSMFLEVKKAFAEKGYGEATSGEAGMTDIERQALGIVEPRRFNGRPIRDWSDDDGE